MISKTKTFLCLFFLIFGTAQTSSAQETSTVVVKKSHVEWVLSLQADVNFKIIHPKQSATLSTVVDTNADSAVFCGHKNFRFEHADLYMPEHHHGSTALQFVTLDGSCVLLSDLNFTMPGLWQIRVKVREIKTGKELILLLAGVVSGVEEDAP